MTGDWSDYIRLPRDLGQPSWVELLVIRGTSCHRELAGPADYTTPRQLLLAHGVPIVSCWSRNWFSGDLSPLDLHQQLETGMTVVAVVELPQGGLPRVQQLLDSAPQILPARMAWPSI